MARVIHASYSGYFPFCIRPLASAEIFDFISSVSLRDAMALFWKARQIKISGTYQALLPVVETREFQITWERDAASEARLVCNPGFRIVSSNNIELEPTPPFLGFVDDISTFNNSYVCPFRVQGSLADTFDEGFGYDNPRTIAGPQSFILEGTEITGNGPEDTKIEITEYWDYDGLYSTKTGLPV